MSGFLHQLALRSLGLAPRMRSAAPSPQPPPQNLAASEDAWPVATPADAAEQAASMDAPAPAAGLAALDQWARTQPRLAPRRGYSPEPVQAGAHGPGAPATTAGARASAPTASPPAPAHAALAASPPRAALLRHDARWAAMQQADTPAFEARPGAQPSWASPDTAPADGPRGRRAANDVHADSRPASARDAQAWEPPVARAMPDRRPIPDVHITIDRLEVAPPAPAPRAAPPARSAALSLRAYLATRRPGQP
ncbi:hypothetical protein [Achromobacter deleyi]|uniref:hypothetical protein n=1 Tax=Achromobacter deleyi TaxID=1353891 RepID=UPI001492C0F2|nr:hypothetical protein [Achromobacter deleyi]QVQ26402.1 hypothetical protein HLG70_26765 [Achromobacter deleyi]UIP21966.1 hypothetical protein LYZ39_05435 [Achromobacter deleyi]